MELSLSQKNPELREELKAYYDNESWAEIERLEKDIYTRKLNGPEIAKLAEFMRLEFRNNPAKLHDFLVSEQTKLYATTIKETFTGYNLIQLKLYVTSHFQNTPKYPLVFGNIPDECPTGFIKPPPAKRRDVPIVVEKQELLSLKNYIMNHQKKCTPECFKNIENIIKEYGSDYTVTVYRGQRNHGKTIVPCRFFSTTSDKSVSLKFTQGLQISTSPDKLACCMFVVNLVEARALDLTLIKYDEGKNAGQPISDESEILVLGGGKFFQDKELTISGFKDVGGGNFETYYTHSKNGGGRRKTKKHNYKSSKTKRRSRK